MPPGFTLRNSGIIKMKLRAQSNMYSKGLNKESENHVMRCKTYQTISKQKQKQSAKAWKFPTVLGKSWCRLILQRWYTISVNCWLLLKVSNSLLVTILSILGCDFCCVLPFQFFAIPDKTISDNGSLWQRYIITQQPDMDSRSPQAFHITPEVMASSEKKCRP